MPRLFNGSSDVILANGARFYSNLVERSYAAWVRGASVNGAIYAEARNVSTNAVFMLASDLTAGTKLRCFIKADTGQTMVDATTTAVAFDSGWHHICATQDTSRHVLLYVDGILDLTATQASGTISGSTGSINDLAIGALVRSTTAAFYAGSIAEVASWSRQLSAGEVLSLANGLAASHLAPSHYWPLWGIDSPEPDIGGSSTNTDGTLTGTSQATGGPPVGLSLLEI